MRTHRYPWRAMRRPIVVLTVAALASACAGPSTPQAHGSATSISATSTTRPDPKAAVLAAYQRFWDVWQEANDPPNPNDPRLAQVDTGAQLALDKRAIAKHKTDGVAFRLAVPSRANHQPIILRQGSRSAQIEDCSLDDGVIFDRRTGSVVNDAVVTHLWRVSLVLEGGLWKVIDNVEVGHWRGTSNCGLG